MLVYILLVMIFVIFYFNCLVFSRIWKFRKVPLLRKCCGDLTANQITVVIAVRDESANVVECIRRYTALPAVKNLIIVDDESTDNTLSLVLEQSYNTPNIIVPDRSALPEGWTGKCYALHKGSKFADTKYLFFTDADVKIRLGLLSSAIIYMEAAGLDHISGHFKILCGSISEKICAPVMAVSSFIFLFGRSGMQGAAMGAFNLISTDFYLNAGGHEAIKDSVIDDVALARIVRQKGGRSVFLDLSDSVEVRLFSGFYGFWNIIVRSSQAYLGSDIKLGISGGTAVFIIASFTAGCLFIPSFLWIFNHLTFARFAVCVIAAAAVYLQGILCIWLVRRFYECSVYWSFLYPLPMAVLGVAVMVSGLKKMFNCQILWRGRSYKIK